MNESEKTTQVGKALLALRSMTLSGELPPNERLSEVALAERLGLSRTPLREAMARLVHEGLLERMPNGGCRVCRFGIDDIIDAIELRGVLEGTAARLAAERGADEAALRRCRETVRELDEIFASEEAGRDGSMDAGAMDFDLYVALNERFHRQIAQLCASPIVLRELERVQRLPLASPSSFLQGQQAVPAFRASLRGAQEQHRALIEAIERREGARAEALAREHARLARRNLDYVLHRDPTLAERIPGLALLATEL